MKKTAVYSVTPNCIKFLTASVKSLLINSDVDEIYILTNEETEDFKNAQFPSNVIVREVDPDIYINVCGPNRGTIYTPMCLLRCAFHKLFPDHQEILSLDYDAIIDDDISELWDICKTEEFEKSYIAGAKEMGRCMKIIHGMMFGASDYVQMGEPDYKWYTYLNFGVIMMNLKRLRETGKGDEVLNYVNYVKRIFPEQDAYNIVCSDGLMVIDSEYNACQFTSISERPKVVHYVGKEKDVDKYELAKGYFEWPWEKILEHRKKKYGK